MRLQNSFYEELPAHTGRDPRAIISSLYRLPKNWTPYLKDENGTVICRNMRSNMEHFNRMKQERILHSGNFLEVHYDSWMEDLMEQTLHILRFLGTELTGSILSDIQAHFSLSKPGYLSTYRGTGWDRHRWRGELTQQQLHYVQGKCGLAGTGHQHIKEETSYLEILH